jgi:hypothetical protein
MESLKTFYINHGDITNIISTSNLDEITFYSNLEISCNLKMFEESKKSAIKSFRKDRNKLLSETDFYFLADSYKIYSDKINYTTLQTYRQNLRDITKNIVITEKNNLYFPDMQNIEGYDYAKKDFSESNIEITERF